MRKKAKDRRRTLVVTPTVQRRIVAAVATPPAIGLAIATVIVAVYCRRLVAEAIAADADLPSLVPLFLSVLGLFVIATVLITVRGLRFSHRIAGPSLNICRSIAQAREGDLSVRIHLRRGDFLTEIAEELNGLLEDLESRASAGSPTWLSPPGGDRDESSTAPRAAGRIPGEGASIRIGGC